MNISKKRIGLLFAVGLIHSAEANTWEVTSTSLNPLSAGTFPWAINMANADAAPPRIINFNLAQGSTIAPVVAFSAITNNNIDINGWGTNGVQSTPRVILNGSLLSTGDGLIIQGRSNLVRGLVIINFPDDGIAVSGRGNTIAGNYIGLNLQGLAQGNDGRGLFITGDDTIVGGTNATSRNIVSGNGEQGIYLFGAFSNPARRNILLGNYIGTDIQGNSARGNGTLNATLGYGVHLFDAADNQIGTPGCGNLISGNLDSGIWIDGSIMGTNNTIVANKIGTDVSGTNALPNGESGIGLYTTGNTVGGASNTLRNIISGNSFYGVDVGDDENQIIGNYIGVDVTGSNRLDNMYDAVFVVGSGNIIGGAATNAGNVIVSDLGHDISILGTSNCLYRNIIGTDAGKIKDLGSDDFVDAIQIQGAYNRIGQATNNAGNIIAYGGNYGLALFTADTSNTLISGNTIYSNAHGGVGLNFTGSRNKITQNSIHGNGGLAIDLDMDGVTTNDPAPDADAGPNDLQNFPAITNAMQGSTHICGFLESKPNAVYALEFFANALCDPGNHGEGEIYVGATIVTGSPNGIAYFDAAFSYNAATSMFMTATATDTNGNTSELGQCTQVQGGDQLDGDGDGIPDLWETSYVGTTNLMNDTSDTDGDGTSDVEEYIADTNPTDTNSYLRIVALNQLNTTQLVITAASCSQNRNYTWISAEALNTFSDLATVSGQNGNLVYTTTNNLFQNSFYTINAKLP